MKSVASAVMLTIMSAAAVSCAHVAPAPLVEGRVALGEHYRVTPNGDQLAVVERVPAGVKPRSGEYLIRFERAGQLSVLSVANRTGQCVPISTQAQRPGDNKILAHNGFLALDRNEPTSQSWSRNVPAVRVSFSAPRSCSSTRNGPSGLTATQTTYRLTSR